MSVETIGNKVPFRTHLETGKRIRWCSCGLSAEQPFCDDSHLETEFLPKLFRAEQDITAALCGCKETRRPPYCDGTHLHTTGKDAAGRFLPIASAMPTTRMEGAGDEEEEKQ